MPAPAKSLGLQLALKVSLDRLPLRGDAEIRFLLLGGGDSLISVGVAKSALLAAVGGSRDRPELFLADHITPTFRTWQERDLFLNPRCQIEQTHDLSDTSFSNVPKPRKFCLVGHHAFADDPIKPNCQGHQPQDSWHTSGRHIRILTNRNRRTTTEVRRQPVGQFARILIIKNKSEPCVFRSFDWLLSRGRSAREIYV